jgi:ANTAR domain
MFLCPEIVTSGAVQKVTEPSPISARSRRGAVRRRWRDPAALDALLRALVTSAEPAVAFTSLAAACVPAFADECHVVLVDDEAAALRIAYPATANLTNAVTETAGQNPANVAVARVEGAAYGEEPAYWATVTFRWHTTTTAATTDDDVDVVIARLLVERVADQVAREQLGAAVDRQTARAANLETALASNREIGQAMGILMATHKLTSQRAFDLLRMASQNSNRKLRDVADDVIHVGDLEPIPKRITPPAPAPHRHLANKA